MSPMKTGSKICASVTKNRHNSSSSQPNHEAGSGGDTPGTCSLGNSENVLDRPANESPITTGNGSIIDHNTNLQTLNQASAASISVQQNINPGNTTTISDGNNNQMPFQSPLYSAATEQQVCPCQVLLHTYVSDVQLAESILRRSNVRELQL